MAREAKAKAASCWLDRIMVTGAVMRQRTWGRAGRLRGRAEPGRPSPRRVCAQAPGSFPLEKDSRSRTQTAPKQPPVPSRKADP